MSARAQTIFAVLAVLAAAVVVSNIAAGRPGNAPHPNDGNMITAAAAQRAGATVLPTSPE